MTDLTKMISSPSGGHIEGLTEADEIKVLERETEEEGLKPKREVENEINRLKKLETHDILVKAILGDADAITMLQENRVGINNQEDLLQSM